MSKNDDEFWLYQLCLNLLSYAFVVVPGFFAVKYGRRYFERRHLRSGGDVSWKVRLLRLCLIGNDDLISAASYQQIANNEADVEADAKPADGRISRNSAIDPANWLKDLPRPMLLLFCFGGLMVSYLTWGILQEKIMTRDYHDGQRFRNSQFLVFVNRILAFCFAGIYVLLTRQVRHAAPLYKYSYCSMSNILSSWFQYEALKYVTFPTQVLAKSCKVIPVMLMGGLVNQKVYRVSEYAIAVIISTGVAIFSLSRMDDSIMVSTVAYTSASGFIILAGYLLLDSFTSNWQSALYKTYHMTPSQMMCGVNLFSSLFTLVSLLGQRQLLPSIEFAVVHPVFLYDIIVLSICSATGQTFIYFTVEQFGPVNFTIMMTIRQAIAIVLSVIIYQHNISFYGIFGITVVFIGIILQIYRSYRRQTTNKVHSSNIRSAVSLRKKSDAAEETPEAEAVQNVPMTILGQQADNKRLDV